MTADFDVGRVGLGNAGVDAQRIDLGHVEELSSCGCAGVDQRAGIDVAAGEHAGERRVDVLERLELFEAAHVGVGGGQVGLALLVSAALLVGLLRGDRVGLAQVLPALGGDLGQFHLRENLLARGAGLVQLLIHLRRIDLASNSPFFTRLPMSLYQRSR